MKHKSVHQRVVVPNRLYRNTAGFLDTAAAAIGWGRDPQQAAPQQQRVPRTTSYLFVDTTAAVSVVQWKTCKTCTTFTK